MSVDVDVCSQGIWCGSASSDLKQLTQAPTSALYAVEDLGLLVFIAGEEKSVMFSSTAKLYGDSRHVFSAWTALTNATVNCSPKQFLGLEELIHLPWGSWMRSISSA